MDVTARLLRPALSLSGLRDHLPTMKSGTLVLMYHAVHSDERSPGYRYTTSARSFEEQIRWLESFVTFVGLEEVIESSGKPDGLRVHVTFDDGYQNALENAYPILERRGIPSTWFLTTGFIESGYTTFLGWDDLSTFDDSLTSFGSHCRYHFDLSSLNRSDVETELKESKQQLESRLDRPIEYLSYPYGGHDAGIIASAKRVGYAGALKDRLHRNRSNDRPYAVGRVSIDQRHESLSAFAANITAAPTIGRVGDRDER